MFLLYVELGFNSTNGRISAVAIPGHESSSACLKVLRDSGVVSDLNVTGPVWLKTVPRSGDTGLCTFSYGDKDPNITEA